MRFSSRRDSGLDYYYERLFVDSIQVGAVHETISGRFGSTLEIPSDESGEGYYTYYGEFDTVAAAKSPIIAKLQAWGMID